MLQLQTKTYKIEFEYRNNTFYKRVADLHSPGISFGEIALIKSCKRTATVKAETDVDMASLHNARTEKSLGKLDEDDVLDKINFLRSIQCFVGLTLKRVEKYL